VLKAYKYRIYPTEDQKVLLNKHIGACRFLYNLALETRQTAYAGNIMTDIMIRMMCCYTPSLDQYHLSLGIF